MPKKVILPLVIVIIVAAAIVIYMATSQSDKSAGTNTNTNAPADCQRFFDGCNTCTRGENGVATCTGRYCKAEEYEPYRCLDNEPSANTNTNPLVNTASGDQWQEGGVAVAGAYADADVVELGNGQWRMYYSAEPEVANFQGQVYSAVSTDGVSWTVEDGTRRTWSIFPDVVTLADGTYRMYFQNSQVIKSAVSPDGLTWTDEAGTRIDVNETGFTLENVAAPTVMQLPDDTWLMVYRGTIDEPYQTTEQVPNNNTQLFFWATSPDGLTLAKQGVAVDSRDDRLYGLTDGPELVRWDNGELRLSFWSYTGVYHSVYSNGTFSAPVFDWTNNTNSLQKFPPNPPGDPTYAYIDDVWYMYYGTHTQGIYYATLE
ncbi:MAG: hypothetical protein V1685_07190 [Parcubacteria group bacterium]